MSFNSELIKRNLLDITKPIKRLPIKSINTEKFYMFMEDIIKNGRRVLLDCDYDPDGGFSGVVFKKYFDRVRFNNYFVNKLTKKRHTIDSVFVDKVLMLEYEYVIIVDSSSSELELINRMCDAGVKVIIIDHHECVYEYSDYPENCCIINSRIEMKEKDIEWDSLSACCLVFGLLDDYNKNYNFVDMDDLIHYALITLYSDCCDMSSSYNRSVYFEAMSKEVSLPDQISFFIGEYQSYKRRFIEFTFVPFINALFRLERFSLLEEFLFNFDNIGAMDKQRLCEKIISVKAESQDIVNKCFDLIERTVGENFVVGDLTPLTQFIDLPVEILGNFTGLVANMLGNKYSKTAFVYYHIEGSPFVKGSVRDLYGRNYLRVFKQFSKAGGHNSAFGLSIPTLGFSKFMHTLNEIDKNYSIKKIENEPIFTDWDLINIADSDFKKMAFYNEFSGSFLPVAMVKKVCTRAMKKTTYDYKSYFRFEDENGDIFSVACPVAYLPTVGDTFIIKPIMRKGGYGLNVETLDVI